MALPDSALVTIAVKPSVHFGHYAAVPVVFPLREREGRGTQVRWIRHCMIRALCVGSCCLELVRAIEELATQTTTRIQKMISKMISKMTPMTPMTECALEATA